MPDTSISIVVPVYRSSRSLPELVGRLIHTLDPLGRPYELVLVDDCSPDDSWAVLERLRARHGARVKIASLARNRGQHNALLCGFSIANGDVVVTMDDDLQNPPEEVPRLISAIDEGFDLAIGSYETKQHARSRNASGQLIDRLILRMFSLPSDFSLTSFRAASGELVRKATEMTGVYPYVTCILLTNSARPTNVVVRHDARRYDDSNYTMRRSLSLAANLLFSYSTAPVRAVAALGAGAVVATTIIAIATLVIAIRGNTVPGWASTLLLLATSNAITLTCLTILAVYVGRVSRGLSGAHGRFTIREMHD
jgi:glycosyltransferase involved in cell wall biosynthesis